MEKRELAQILSAMRADIDVSKSVHKLWEDRFSKYEVKTEEFTAEIRLWRLTMERRLSKQTGFWSGVVATVSLSWILAFAIFEFLRDRTN